MLRNRRCRNPLLLVQAFDSQMARAPHRESSTSDAWVDCCCKVECSSTLCDPNSRRIAENGPKCSRLCVLVDGDSLVQVWSQRSVFSRARARCTKPTLRAGRCTCVARRCWEDYAHLPCQVWANKPVRRQLSGHCSKMSARLLFCLAHCKASRSASSLRRISQASFSEPASAASRYDLTHLTAPHVGSVHITERRQHDG